MAKCLVWKTRLADSPGIYSLPIANGILVILFFFGFKLGCEEYDLSLDATKRDTEH